MKKLAFILILLFSSTSMAYSLHNYTGYNMEVYIQTPSKTEYYTMNWYKNYQTMKGFTPGERANIAVRLSHTYYNKQHSTFMTRYVTIYFKSIPIEASLTFIRTDDNKIRYKIEY